MSLNPLSFHSSKSSPLMTWKRAQDNCEQPSCCIVACSDFLFTMCEATTRQMDANKMPLNTTFFHTLGLAIIMPGAGGWVSHLCTEKNTKLQVSCSLWHHLKCMCDSVGNACQLWLSWQALPAAEFGVLPSILLCQDVQSDNSMFACLYL